MAAEILEPFFGGSGGKNLLYEASECAIVPKIFTMVADQSD